MRQRQPHPFIRLAIAARAAARDMDHTIARQLAGRDAERIPVCLQERAPSRKAEMARLARRTLAALPTMEAGARDDARGVLLACAAALSARFEQTSEQIYSGRNSRRNNTEAGRLG